MNETVRQVLTDALEAEERHLEFSLKQVGIYQSYVQAHQDEADTSASRIVELKKELSLQG